MLTCKEAARLVSDGLDRELAFWRRMSLRLHVALCRGCSRYKRQITTLNRAISDHYAAEPPADVAEEVSRDTLKQIKASLRHASPDTGHQDGK